MSQSHVNVADRSLFSLSWPIMIDSMLHVATPLINVVMVSKLSKDYLAAMMVGNQIFSLCITIFNFISVGCAIVIAQYLGAKRTEHARNAVQLSIAINFSFSVLVALFLFFFGYIGLELVNTPAEIIDNSFTYLHILGFCLIPEVVSIILASTLRVYGRTQGAMYVTMAANIVTVIGNAIVLYGHFGLPQLGLWGVAWSTMIGRLVSVVLLFCMLRFGVGLRFELSAFFNWQKELLKKILSIGLPAAGENVLWMSQYILAISFIGLMGTTSLAAQSVYSQIVSLVVIFGGSVSIANEIQVGYLVGEKRFDEAYKRTFRSLRLGIAVTLGVAILFCLCREWVASYLSDDIGVITTILPLFVLLVFMEPGRTINIVMVTALRAAGDAKFPMYMGVIFMWGVSVPLGYFLGIKMEFGLIGIWLGFFADEWLRGLANAWRWKSKAWQSKRLDVDH